MISAGDFRNGVTIELEGNIYQIIEFQHVKPGKGAAFVRTKLKNIKSGGVVEKTFRPTEKCPQARIDRKEMQYLYDDQGKEYIDFFAGVSVMNCGHCNKEMLDVAISQMQTLQHTTIIYLTEQMVNLAEKLAMVLPGNLRRSFFCCTGSEANEGAMLLARLYTGKNDFIALHNGLHGRTHLTMSATAIPMWRADPDLSTLLFLGCFGSHRFFIHSHKDADWCFFIKVFRNQGRACSSAFHAAFDAALDAS